MAETRVTVAAGDLAAHELRLEPGVPMRIDFMTGTFGSTTVEVLSHDGAAAVYFTTDGTAPAVRGAKCKVLPAAVTSVEALPVATGRGRMLSIRLVSEGAPLLSVSRSTP